MRSATYPVMLGNTKVIIRVYRNGPGKSFVHVHENETTALKAAKTVVHRHGGTLLTLEHGGDRYVTFVLRRQRYSFDPNRIFTDDGIYKTLSACSHYSPAAAIEVKRFAERILSLLPKTNIIGVHNNNEYSFLDYLPKQPLFNDAHALNYNSLQFYRNFFFVTQGDTFLRLQRREWNVVLQSAFAPNDGSMSIYFANHNYINVEAGYDQLEQQIKMLEHA